MSSPPYEGENHVGFARFWLHTQKIPKQLEIEEGQGKFPRLPGHCQQIIFTA